MTESLQRFVLGQRCKVAPESTEQVDALIDKLFDQANHRLFVRAERLDSGFFASDRLASCVSTLVRKNLRNEVRFLVDDIDHLISRRRKTLVLARRFSSYVRLREPDEQDKGGCGTYIVADGIAYIHHAAGSVYPAQAESYDPAFSRRLENEFQRDWERGHHVTELSTAGL